MSYYPQPSTSYSPPPLQHPIPTHPPTAPPEPPATPGSPSGYMRFTSGQASPGQQYAQAGAQPGYSGGQYAQPQWQSFGAVPAGVGAVPVPGTGPQPHHPQAAPGFSFPSAWGVNDATAQMGVQLGRSAVAAGQDYMEKNFGQHFLPMSMLKHQFNVSNHYVLKKLQLVLFPWRHKPWTRRIQRSTDAQDAGGPPRYLPPREDLNSPDLYIPVMALVTYVLVAAIKTGLRGPFDPEVLGLTASKALAIVLIECAVVRLGCYFLNIQSTGQFVDLLAFGGYKFVGIIVTLLASMLHSGNLLYWTVFLYCFLANAFFLLRSLRSIVLPDPSVSHSAPLTHAQRSLRVQFLFVLAVLQVGYMGVLVRV